MPVNTEWLNALLARRQGGYGRGGRMEIEQDQVEVLTGLRGGVTIGSPVVLCVQNRDCRIDELPEIWAPRPGHVDLAGLLKFGRRRMRDYLERASARETAARVAAGGLAQSLLQLFDIVVTGYVVAIGGVESQARFRSPKSLVRRRDGSAVYCPDAQATQAIRRRIDRARQAGDTLGGIIQVIAWNTPPGLGSHAQWTDRLDGQLAQALMAIPAIKGVEIGDGFAAAGRLGSAVQDEITYRRGRGYQRRSNRAGGIEGGISNGQPIIVRVAMKPIPTLGKPLRTVDVRTKRPARAARERADVCAVPAASVVAEAAVSFVLASALLAKFGGDSVDEVRPRVTAYRKRLSKM